MTESIALDQSPTKYIRINVTKNTKGYSYETTISVQWLDDGRDIGDELDELLMVADQAARDEIDRRKRADETEGEGWS